MRFRFDYSGQDIQELTERSGQEVNAVPLDESKYDREEVGPMFHITFADGFEHNAFGDELTPITTNNTSKEN